MINRIKEILINNKNVDEFEIVETKVESNELFLIKKNVDMDRAKNVHHFKVIVYKNIEENGVKYKGSASIRIHPTMSEEEINSAINEAIFAAKFARNGYYPLVNNRCAYTEMDSNSFSHYDLPYWMNKITESVYKNDNFKNGEINSCEIFLDKVYTRIINSEGVDVQGENYKGMVEFIPTWKEEGEEIELYSRLEFSDFHGEYIAEEVNNMLSICKERAIATKTPDLGKFSVILTRNAVQEFLSYYYHNSNAMSVYLKQSNWKVGDNVQGKEVIGDLITMKLDPFMKNSIFSLSFDEDGFPLQPVDIIENGVLNNYIADYRYAHYLKVNPTGNIKNIVIAPGSKTMEALKEEPYLEVVAFSDFTVDKITGNFGGEIRLALYFDGEKVIPVTGGSISGNINEIQDKMYLSKELQKHNNFQGPKAIKILNVNVAGV